MEITGDVTKGVTSDTSVSDWRSTLPEVLREAPYFKNAKSLEDAATQISSAAYWQGNSILKPGANASDEAKAANRQKIQELYPEFMPVPDPYGEDVATVFSKLGRPDAPEKYKMPEGSDISPDKAAQLMAIAHQANLTQAQFEKQQAGIMARRRELSEQRKHAHDTEIAALRAQWGATFEPNMAQVRVLAANDKNMPEELKTAVEAGTLSAGMIRWLSAIAQSGDESTQIPGQQGQTSVMTPEQGRQEAHELRQRLFSMTDLDPMKPILMKKLIEAERYSIGMR